MIDAPAVGAGLDGYQDRPIRGEAVAHSLTSRPHYFDAGADGFGIAGPFWGLALGFAGTGGGRFAGGIVLFVADRRGRRSVLPACFGRWGQSLRGAEEC